MNCTHELVRAMQKQFLKSQVDSTLFSVFSAVNSVCAKKGISYESPLLWVMYRCLHR